MQLDVFEQLAVTRVSEHKIQPLAVLESAVEVGDEGTGAAKDPQGLLFPHYVLGLFLLDDVGLFQHLNCKWVD